MVLLLVGVPGAISFALRAVEPLEVGSTSVVVEGEREFDGYRVLAEATATGDAAEYLSTVELKIVGFNDAETMPVMTVRVGADGPLCSSGEGERWLFNYRRDLGYSLLVLICKSFVGIAEFRRDPVVTLVVDSE